MNATSTNATPEGIAHPLAPQDVAFARSDAHGTILAANETFHRLVGIGWDQLVGMPFRALRDPDMPRAVFWAMWETLGQRQPYAGYLRNRLPSGESVWIFSLILPLPDGFVSLQTRPMSSVWGKVGIDYENLRSLERHQTLSPEKSALVLAQDLAELGLGQGTDLTRKLLAQELAQRTTASGPGSLPGGAIGGDIGTALQETLALQTSLLEDFEALQSIPNNMRIIASRLEPSGGPVSAISENYKFASTEISRRLHAFASGDDNLCQNMVTIVANMMFEIDVTHLLAGAVLGAAGHPDSARAEPELAILEGLRRDHELKARQAIAQADRVSGELHQASAELRRMMLGLDTIRVMGRVESGRLGMAGVGLAATVDQLNQRHGEIAARLQNLMKLSASIRKGISRKSSKAA